MGLAGPVGVVADPDWNLFVCDCNANAIVQVKPDGEVKTLAAGALFACPNGITRDVAGNLYVVNFANDLLVRIDPSGQASEFATVGAGNGNAHVALAGERIYVTKIKTNELFAVRLDGTGEPVLVAGSGAAEIVDGAGAEAALKSPNGLAAGPEGERLYMNNIVGTWREPEPTRLVLRVVELP